MLKVLITFIVLLCGSSLSAQNQNLSNGNIFDGEPFLVVNPSNHSHMVVAWMGYFPFTKIVIKTKENKI